MHDFLKSAIRADVLWLQGTCARMEMKRGNRRKANHSQQKQTRTRKNQHGRRFAYGPAHIFPYDVEQPVITNCRLSVANKQEQNRAHEQTGDENANRNEHTKLRKTHGATQHQREESNCSRESAEEHRSTKSCHGNGNGFLMEFSVGARLVVPPERENWEIDTQPDENGGEARDDRAESG